jgi:hypothetical protein
MSSDRRRPTAQTVLVSRHAADRYRDRVRPGLDVDAGRAELERLRGTGEISSVAHGWLNGANPAPQYLLLGKDVVLRVLPQGDGWIATTCVTQPTVTPTRRASKSAGKASLASSRRARRRTRF